MRLVADGKPWRSKHIIERAAKGERPAVVTNELAKLWEEGRLAKVRWGVWVLAGKRMPKAKDIRPLHRERLGGPTGQKVLARLSAPTPAPTLVEELGVSRQRIDQVLKLLLEQGKVSRVPHPGAVRQWLWFRSDVKPKTFLRRRAPPMSTGQTRVLNVLEPGTWHWVSDVIAAAAAGQSPTSAAKNLKVLEARGYVAAGRSGHRRYVAITRRGVQHPSREPGHAYCPPADLPEDAASEPGGHA